MCLFFWTKDQTYDLMYAKQALYHQTTSPYFYLLIDWLIDKFLGRVYQAHQKIKHFFLILSLVVYTYVNNR